MERDYKLVAKVFMILSLMYASISAVGAVRPLMMNNEEKATVVNPQNWPGFTFPRPGFGFSSPSFSFRSPSFAFPNPSFAFPNPGFNMGQPGAGSICILFPTSAGCRPDLAASPMGLLGGGSP